MTNSENLFRIHYTNPIILIPLQITSAKLLVEVVWPRLQHIYNQQIVVNDIPKEPQPILHPREEILDSRLANILRHVALCIDAAIEYPLILAYHPTTLLSNRDLSDVLGSTSSQEPSHQVASVCLLILFEKLISTVVHYVICMDGPEKSSGVCIVDGEDGAATDLALDFIIPRAALLVSIAVTGLSLWKKPFGDGGMDVFTLAWWVALRQFM
ncbi:hypothetical protein T440DRAFT_556090 [Plenodomus tracheiphilus IPT5]|uniref:Uncharacterized protein n=1 Tax=Plenodomus tracheiphilus IPT5 TaxID=1408161 RepID=A0A6A7B3Z1_9PLEO|nr:hypothetical protein T440DRAFT_556090 [Plenodomus tracheiphilus IPT5]